MKLFIIVFSLAILFVVGTASMMRYFDRKQLPPANKADDTQDDAES